MFRALVALALLALTAPAQALCLFARDAKPADWYDWATVLVAAEVTAVEQKGRLDVVSLRVIETFKGPVGVDTVTLQIPNNLWQACKLERPTVGERVLGALNANHDALTVPLAASYGDQLRAARPGPAIPIANKNIKPAPAPVAASPTAPIAMRCVESPVYGATVKVESCEQAAGALFLRGEVLRLARENSIPDVPGLPVPAAGQRYLFFKSGGQCQDFGGKNTSLTGRLSHPCCDAKQPYCSRKTDFLVDDGSTPRSAPAPTSK